MIKTIDTSAVTSEMEAAMEGVFIKRFGRGARAFDPGITDEQIYAAWRSSKDNYMEHVRAALEAAPEVKAEPEFYQVRARPLWYTKPIWTEWRICAKDAAEDYRHLKILHDWEYEVRELYLHPPAVSEGWLRAIDEALVCHHIDVANADDSYEVAKDKLNKLLCCVQDIGSYFSKSDLVERIRALPRIYNPSAVSIDDVIALIKGAK